MGNTNSAFKYLPLASQQHHPIVVLDPNGCLDVAKNLDITSKHILSNTYFVSIHGRHLYTIESHALTSKRTIHDSLGAVVASVRSHGLTMNKFTVHSGTSGGKDDPTTPAAMTLKRHRSSGLDVATTTGITLTVAFGSLSHAFVFLGDVASTTAPLIARMSSSGAFKTTHTIEVAAGVDAAAMAAVWAVIKIIIDAQSASAASG
ncbi:hypothetical protein H9P43_009907 [Blastocladiella emersonii ATCC 22665]|nr:hypothetical protein H9P43_009907 [Blastocladiella emersonii ATCC 22665]